MAIYHLATRAGKAHQGQAVKHAEYIEREGLYEDRNDLVAREAGNMPSWAQDDTADFWKAADELERANGRAYREFEVALPRELDHDQQAALVRDFVKEQLGDRHAYEWAIHDKGDGNPHAHIMFSERMQDGVDPDRDHYFKRPEKGGCRKDGRWNVGRGQKSEVLQKARARWAELQNIHLERAGELVRVDHRTLEEQGIDRRPQIHVGFHDPARPAIREERHQRNEDIKLANEAAQIKARAERCNAVEEKFTAEVYRQKGEDYEAARENPGRILERITERQSVFTERELSRAVGKLTKNERDRAALMARIMERPELVELHDPATGELAGYTTREVLAEERRVQDHARRLAGQGGHFAGEAAKGEALAGRTLDVEQRLAFERATSGEGLVVIEGRAGTGKSYTMGAIRESYERSGYKVVGLAPTNTVAQDMKKDGFSRANTVHSEMWHLEHGKVAWDSKTVVCVDEAAMVETRMLEQILAQADEAGAKVILIGDDRQLSSIGRGGMFEVIKEEHGSAEITQVRRQSEEWQQEASMAMSRGDFRAGLQAYQEHGAIQWCQGEAEQKAALIRDWTRANAEEPERVRFVYAATNREVNELNAALQAVRRESGQVHGDYAFETCKGEQHFGEGDRIQFHETKKAEGIYNGQLGTVTRIDNGRIDVRTDAGKSVSINTEEFKGYALGYSGTVYRGQGKTQADVYALHGKAWESKSGYVASTRHKENLNLYVDKTKFDSVEKLASQMRQDRTKIAAVNYMIDEQRLVNQTPQDKTHSIEFSREMETYNKVISYAYTTSPVIDNDLNGYLISRIKEMAAERRIEADNKKTLGSWTADNVDRQLTKVTTQFVDKVGKYLSEKFNIQQTRIEPDYLKTYYALGGTDRQIKDYFNNRRQEYSVTSHEVKPKTTLTKRAAEVLEQTAKKFGNKASEAVKGYLEANLNQCASVIKEEVSFKAVGIVLGEDAERYIRKAVNAYRQVQKVITKVQEPKRKAAAVEKLEEAKKSKIQKPPLTREELLNRVSPGLKDRLEKTREQNDRKEHIKKSEQELKELKTNPNKVVEKIKEYAEKYLNAKGALEAHRGKMEGRTGLDLRLAKTREQKLGTAAKAAQGDLEGVVKDLVAKVGRATVDAALNTAVGPVGVAAIKAVSKVVEKLPEEPKQTQSRGQSRGQKLRH